MIIVAGHVMVDPARRDTYLERSARVVAAARDAEGCWDYVMGADLLDAGRVNILERWESRAAVTAFRGNGPEGDQATDILGGDVREYDAGDETRVL